MLIIWYWSLNIICVSKWYCFSEVAKR